MTVDVGQGLLNALLYLGIPSIIGMIVSMYLWEKTCRKKIKVLLVKAGGGAETIYAPKEGGDVTITNKLIGVTRTWPINSLATIPVPYPELGVLPRFLQREIQMVILHEGDWEPMLNRSPHREKIMSPDAIAFLNTLAAKYPDDKELTEAVAEFLDGVSTGPTREMIADPSVLGALKVSAVMKALASVGDDLMEALKQIRNQLSRFAGLSSMAVYIMLGLLIILAGVSLYLQVQGGVDGASTDLSAIADEVAKIKSAIGMP